MRKMTKRSKSKSRKYCRTTRDKIKVQEVQFLMNGGFTKKVKGSANIINGKTNFNFEEVFIPLNIETKRIFLSV